ncbi:MAG: Gfo/Idh/MocA family oxidoreductase [Nitrospirae bacterium]|nr:Gfo/Idh/MocA family oxidoreductase [Nitrospirota bacterium]
MAETVRKLRVGVIGVGYLGYHHARIYRELPQAELVAVADLDRARAEAVGREFGAMAVTDYRVLIGKVEAVSIAAPTPLHYAIAKDCLQGGMDVLLEKPVTTTVEEADDLGRIAKDARRVLQVGHLERFNGAVRAMVPLVHEPKFIESHRMGSFVERASNVDVVLDLMIHDLDIILSLVRAPVREVRASGVAVLSRKVDLANTRLTFEGGCVANVTASRISPQKMRKIRIFQPGSYLSLDYDRQELHHYRLDAGGAQPRIVGGAVAIRKEEPLRAELEAFLVAVRDRTPPIVTGVEGRNALSVALSVLEAVNRSLQ